MRTQCRPRPSKATLLLWSPVYHTLSGVLVFCRRADAWKGPCTVVATCRSAFLARTGSQNRRARFLHRVELPVNSPAANRADDANSQGSSVSATEDSTEPERGCLSEAYRYTMDAASLI